MGFAISLNCQFVVFVSFNSIMNEKKAEHFVLMDLMLVLVICAGHGYQDGKMLVGGGGVGCTVSTGMAEMVAAPHSCWQTHLDLC